jgi:hypothetical protein
MKHNKANKTRMDRMIQFEIDPILKDLVEPITPEYVVGQLKEWLEKDLGEPKNCPRCGGIHPEIQLVLGGKTYYLTCWKVTEKGKILAETDFEKVVRYYRAESELKE